MVFFTGLLIFVLPLSSFTNQSKIVLYDIESGPNSPATTPQNKEVDVISIYSDSFTNVPNTNFYANWNQKTNVSEVSIDGNKILKYTDFNYQGIEFGSSVDASSMEYLHIDIWTADASAMNVEIISPGPNISSYSLAIYFRLHLMMPFQEVVQLYILIISIFIKVKHRQSLTLFSLILR